MDRLEFLKRTGSLLAAGALSPVLTNNLFARSKGANDRINVALVGCRNMGWGDLSDALLVPDVRCVALCDIDRQILENRASELEKRTGVKPDRYSRSLALSPDGGFMCRRQGCICRETDSQFHRRMRPHGSGRQEVRPCRASRTAAAQRDPLARHEGIY